MLGIGTQKRQSKAWGGSGKLGLLFIELSLSLAGGINKFLQCLCCLTRWKAEWVLMGQGWGERGWPWRPLGPRKGLGKEEPAMEVSVSFHGRGNRLVGCTEAQGGAGVPRAQRLCSEARCMAFLWQTPAHITTAYTGSNTLEPQSLPWGALSHQLHYSALDCLQGILHETGYNE